MPADTVSLAKARTQLEVAQANLVAALESGTDTAAARADVAAAAARLAALEARAQAPVADPTPSADREAIEAEAANLLRVVSLDLADTIRPLLAIDWPRVNLPGDAARRLAEARQALASAEAGASAARDRVAALEGRIAAAEARREQIRTDRLAGRIDDARQGADLALVGLDLEGLAGLLQEARAACPDVLGAAAELREAELSWSRAVAEVKARAALAVAGEIQDRLVAALRAADGLPYRDHLPVDPDLRRRVSTNGGRW